MTKAVRRKTSKGKTRSTRRLSHALSRGFTLVELAVVVTIVGVLAVIAVVGYRKLTLSSKVSEAQGVISAIRIAQEDYRAERGSYANIGAGWCPSDGHEQKKYAWTPTCSGGPSTWASLPVHIDGPVQFGYRVAAGASDVADPFSTGVDFSGADRTVPWYIIQAQADLNGDGVLFTQLTGSSFSNQIFTRNEGD
jgi:type IV pilus assembly protein PilA